MPCFPQETGRPLPSFGRRSRTAGSRPRASRMRDAAACRSADSALIYMDANSARDAGGAMVWVATRLAMWDAEGANRPRSGRAGAYSRSKGLQFRVCCGRSESRKLLRSPTRALESPTAGLSPSFRDRLKKNSTGVPLESSTAKGRGEILRPVIDRICDR